MVKGKSRSKYCTLISGRPRQDVRRLMGSSPAHPSDPICLLGCRLGVGFMSSTSR